MQKKTKRKKITWQETANWFSPNINKGCFCTFESQIQTISAHLGSCPKAVHQKMSLYLPQFAGQLCDYTTVHVQGLEDVDCSGNIILEILCSTSAS